MPQNRPRRAFTLAELLIVIGIIIVLVGILLPVIGKVRRAAYTASTANQISVLSSAIEQYHNDFNAYPGPIPESQIYMKVNTAGNTGQPQPFVIDGTGTPQKLQMIATGPATGFDATQITGAQNLVLGLLGGLSVTNNAGTVTFAYDPTVIYPSTAGNKTPGSAPGVSGPSSLSLLGTHQASHAYITPSASDLYNPFDGTNLHPFTDAAQRMAGDAGIPVFLDKYPDAMPILYMRANRGAAAVVTLNGNDGTESPPQSNGNAVTAQYDLVDIIGYTTPPPNSTPSTTPGQGIGTSVPYYHGLQNVWTAKVDSPQIHPTNASYSFNNTPCPFHPLDAWAYLRNPDLGPPIPPAGSPPATDVGVPRQKDGYILISAGPDRIYGTTDDVTNFGSVAP